MARITYVDEPTRKSKRKATVTDSRGKRKTRCFKTEKEARGFLRNVDSNTNKLKVIMDSGVTFSVFVPLFLETKKKSSMKPTSYQTLRQNVEQVEKHLGNTFFSKSIGHTSVRTTMEIYTHLDMTQNRHVQHRLEDLKDF